MHQLRETKKIHFRNTKHQLDHDCWFKVGVFPDKVLQTNDGLVTLYQDGWLYIRRNYAWDGASGPTWDTKSCKRGSMVHDALSDLIKEGYLSPDLWTQCNVELYRLCKEDGMWAIRRSAWFAAVERFGLRVARRKEKVYTAP